MNNFNLNSSFLLTESFGEENELIRKIQEEDENVLIEYINKGIFDYEIEEFGETISEIPFLFAIEKGKLKVAKKILERLNSDYFLKTNSHGQSILHIATINKMLIAIELIMKHIQTWDKKLKNEILFLADKIGRNFMHYLFLKSFEDPNSILKIIAKQCKGSEFFKLITELDKEGNSMIAYAIKSSQIGKSFFTFITKLIKDIFPENTKLTPTLLGIKSNEDFNKFMKYGE